MRFNASGYDSDGHIQEYEFDFGDNSDGQPQVWRQTDTEAYHRYQYPGTFIASLKVKDSRGNWVNGSDECNIEIKVYGEPKVLGKSAPVQLPVTGAPVAAAVAITPASAIGWFLFKKFRLV